MAERVPLQAGQGEHLRLSVGRFRATGVSGAVITAADNYINQILTAGAGSIAPYYSLHPGHVLRPQAAGGQDLITFMVPVPEAGTVMAGALLLLPAGTMLLLKVSKRV